MRVLGQGRIAESAGARVAASAALSLVIAAACSGKVENTGNGGLGVSMGESGGAGGTVAASGGAAGSVSGGLAGAMAGAPISVSTGPHPTPTTQPPVYPPMPPPAVDAGAGEPGAVRDASAAAMDAGTAVLDAAVSGGATACDGTGADAPCLAAGALCWNNPGELVPCSEVYDPLCTCMTGTCECWGTFGMDGPPYPNSPATVCDSTQDTTTCVTIGALCWSVNADVADPCANYSAPACDCDDYPCRCWAEARSRYQ